MHFLIFCLLAGLLAVPALVAQTKVTASPQDWARIQDFANKLAGGYGRLEKKMDEFSTRTGLDIYIVTAYPHNQPDISRLAAEWPQTGKGLLLGLNLHGEENWTQHLRIAYTPEVTGKLPAEKIIQVRDLVLLPLLEGKEIAVVDEFGGTRRMSFAGQGKYYLTLEQGIDALLAAYAGTPFGSVPTLAFTGSPAGRYGFDAKEYEALTSHYGRGLDELTGKETFTPWKALATGKPDVVAVTALGKSSQVELAKVAIKAPDGSTLPARVLRDGQLQVTLPGGAFEGPEEMEAYYPTGDKDGYVLARLNVVRYPNLRKKVVVVPLPGTQNVPSAAQLRDSLNRIYGQAVVEWEVTLETTFDPGTWDGNGDGKIETGHSGLLSNYPEEMRAINKAFRNRYEAYEADAYYVLLAGEAESTGTLGYMPRAKQFGYAFTRFQTPAGVARTVAHELGHGAFHLKHTFDETGLARGTSDNLMDYRNGTRLHKYQWDLVHDPVRVIGLLEEDEEGALAVNWTILDKKYTVLFNHIYDNNHQGNLKYMDKILNARINGNVEKTLDLDYQENEENEWVNQWKLRTSTSDEILEKIISKIQNTKKGEKIPKTSLYEKGIYIGKYNYEETEYPIAIYSEKALISNVIKVQVNEVEELIETENSSHLKCQETIIKYMIVAFYENGQSVPSLIMQIEKFDFSKLQNTKEHWLKFLNILTPPLEQVAEAKQDKKDEDPKGKASFPITGEQLKKVFPSTSQERLNEVAAVINKYSDEFEITTPLRMAHFLGQIGAETGGLNKLNEDDCYREKGIKDYFGKRKYCDLFEGYDASTQTECPKNKLPECEPSISDTTQISTLKVKKKYICSSSLFNYVYGCRMENGPPSTKDGSTYKGKGFIHLTGKDQYKAVSKAWNKLYPNDLKEFHGKDIDQLVENLDVAMKASLIYWKSRNFNKIADNGKDQKIIDKIGSIVNGSGSNLPNGYKERRKHTETAYNTLSQ
jgi:predicted chitinase